MTNDEDDKGAVVIPWPGSKTARPDAPPTEPRAPDDAFDAAVKRALEAREPGPGAEGAADAPRSAEEVVARVVSALSGTGAEEALAAVRARVGAPVIDLQAAREARQKSAEASPELGRLVSEAFRTFVKDLAQREGKAEVVLDGAFFRQHGTELLGSLFKGLAGALTQPPRPPDPTSMTEGAPRRPGPSEREPGEVEQAPPGGDAPHEVRIRVDLGSLIKSLFTRRSEPPREPTPPEPDRDR